MSSNILCIKRDSVRIQRRHKVIKLFVFSGSSLLSGYRQARAPNYE